MMNTRIRDRGVSAKEMMYRRDLVTNEPIGTSDKDLAQERVGSDADRWIADARFWRFVSHRTSRVARHGMGQKPGEARNKKEQGPTTLEVT